MSTTTTTTKIAPARTSLSAPSSRIPTGPVSASLNFYSPPSDGSAPYNYVEDPPAGVPKSNIGTATHRPTISDMRGTEASFSLDKNAFLPLLSSPLTSSTVTDFTSDTSIRGTYYPEVEKVLLSNLPGAHRVFIFDHTVRRADPGASRGPVQRVHIDQTPSSAQTRVKHHLPEEADALLGGRVRLVNVWRPLNGPVASFPLAVADSSSVSDEAIVGVQHRYPDRTGETAGVKFEEGQKWWYWSGMADAERLLLQCYDSESGSRVPHTAFVDERAGENAKPRESIEVRALVFG